MELLEITLLRGRKVTIRKVITLGLAIENAIFTQQCFVLPITNPIILGISFLDIYFAISDIDIVPSPYIALITCFLPVLPAIIHIISTLQR